MMDKQPSALRRFFGAAMVAVGVMIVLLSGACTGRFLIQTLPSLDHGAGIKSILLILGIGLPFIAVGVLIVFEGRALMRRR